MFSILVDRYQEAFMRKGVHMLRSRDLAEDVVQETFIKIYKNAHKFSNRKNASFRSWAYKILTNTCLSLLSRNTLESSRTKNMSLDELDTVSDASDYDYHIKEQVSLVRSVLARLPVKLSRLLHLYFFEEKSYEEIAIQEHVSLSYVRSGLHRAKKQFKNIAIEMI
jgi:RNA polymerase sigma-70 factor (ECF subfamily)